MIDHDNHIFVEAEQMDAPPAREGETGQQYLDRVGAHVLEPRKVLWCLECNCKIEDDE